MENYTKLYNEEAKIFNKIASDFENLKENDIRGAYSLMIISLQAYNRWSKIKLDIKKDLARGQKSALKDRLEEMCKYLKEIHVTSRMIWSKGKDDLRNNKEDY